jgi:hypothetical protein
LARRIHFFAAFSASCACLPGANAMCAAQSMYAPIIAIGESPAVKRAVAACTERSTTSANAVAAYESRMNEGSGGAKPGPGAGFVGTTASAARDAPRRRGCAVAAFAAGMVERERGRLWCASMTIPRARGRRSFPPLSADPREAV